jgi:tryptophanyl-tRNA synthetase
MIMTTKPILISGIQPTGRLHVGNYLGALKNFVELQNSSKYNCYFFIADYHSLTEEFNPKKKSEEIFNLVVDYLAAGIDSKKSKIFVQSQITGHADLAWILSTITPFGELRRMTQFKEKGEAQKENVNVGLFTYPVLMAADILLYDAAFVPVGEDQLQHLEFTRMLARKFNQKFSKTFIEPKAILTPASRIMSLDDPIKKMSKSRPEGCLFIDDKPEDIGRKIKHAVTDSGREIKYDLKNKPGISNMLLIYSGFSGNSIKDLERKFAKSSYVEFKNKLAKLVIDYFKLFNHKKSKLLKDEKRIKEIVKAGNAAAKKITSNKLKEIKKKIGHYF